MHTHTHTHTHTTPLPYPVEVYEEASSLLNPSSPHTTLASEDPQLLLQIGPQRPSYNTSTIPRLVEPPNSRTEPVEAVSRGRGEGDMG